MAVFRRKSVASNFQKLHKKIKKKTKQKTKKKKKTQIYYSSRNHRKSS